MLRERCSLFSDLFVKQPSVIVRFGEGAGCPFVFFCSLEKMEGAERRQALVRNAAPVACLAVTPVSGSPETPGP
jgi:hypothetical protein